MDTGTRFGSRPTALGDLRVLDLTGPIAWYCPRLFADLGADVIRVEHEGDDRIGGFGRSGGALQPEYLFHNAGKRSITVDLADPADQARLHRLAREADILVESFAPGWLAAHGLGYHDLAEANPGLIYTSVTPFGQIGPRSGWRGTDLIGAATGGVIRLGGSPVSPPSQPGGNQAYLQASVFAAAATLVALTERDRTGRGQPIDVSMQDSLVFANENALGVFDLMGHVRARLGDKAFTGQRMFFPARDGWIAVWLGGRWDEFVAWLDEVGIPSEPWRRPEWFDPIYRDSHLGELNDVVGALAARSTRAQFTAAAQRHRIAAAPVATVADLAGDPQLLAREFWVGVEAASEVRFPGAPYKFSVTPWRIARPAPEPGQHNGDGWLGAGIPHPSPHGRPAREPYDTPSLQPNPSGQPSAVGLPLQGIRVLDFSWQIAGPGATQVLADHGADVLKIESRVHPDGLRLMPLPREIWNESPNVSGVFNLFNSSKRSVALDLTTEGGRAILRRLLREVDVIVDNYGVDPFPKWGLTEAAIRELNPDVIIARSSVMGRSGPRAHFVGFGFTIGPAAGLNSLTGFPGDPPCATCTAHPDYSCNSYHFLFAILAALHYRRRTGTGQSIDLSQHESTVVFLGPAIVEHGISGRIAGPSANRHPAMAPHGVYRCRGEDRWVAIACETDGDWHQLATIVERPELASDDRFRTLQARKTNEDELDNIMQQWTRRWSEAEIAERLQSAGIAAGPVQSMRDLLRDPQLRARGKFARLAHGELGRIWANGPGFRLADRPNTPRWAPPLLGQHTEEVLDELLDISGEELISLYVEGVIQ